MSKEKCFEKFLHNIEPSSTTKKYISSIQTNLRSFLMNHEIYKKHILDSFLTGSYAKHTSIRPTNHDGKTDVDIIVVTNYTETDDSKVVLEELYKICKEKYSKVTKQSRSIGIEMDGIEIDVVPLIEDKISGMYKIGNKIDGTWEKTNPKKHLEWCSIINKNNNDKFVRIVKIFKWWRKNNCPATVKYPKGITLERILEINLGNCSSSYETIIYETLVNIKRTFEPFVKNGQKPLISDPGILSNDLLSSYKVNDIKAFIDKIKEHIEILENTNFSIESWRKILGTEFPNEEISDDCLLSVLREKYNSFFNVPYKQKTAWAEMKDTPLIDVKVRCYDEWNNSIDYNPDGNSVLNKNVNIDFTLVGGAVFSNDTEIFWQVVNTGEEAKANHCLRGGFEQSNINLGRHEKTAYTGTHWVQGFVVKDNTIIAKSKEILVKIK